MSVETGIAPRELLALDAEMFDALLEALNDRWTVANELAANAVEIAHASLLAFLRVHSKAGARLPDPLRVERPTSAKTDADAPAPISVAEFSRMEGLTAELHVVKDE